MKNNLFSLVLLWICTSTNAQPSCTLTISYTPPSTVGVCNASASVTAGTSCAVTYTWIPGFYTGSSPSGMCAGNYTVYAYDGGGPLCCGNMTGTVTIPSGPTGITSTTLESEKVFFNNFSGKLIMQELVGEIKIALYDITGKELLIPDNKKSRTEIDLNYLDQGNYIIIVSDALKSRRLKILKE